ncbi:hypothetical protein R3P38DRAFT_3112586 [Favolaschia claudopus]|uniref:Uncharacterized protein n=1 Tax=Favolaschia claudopus TaxID=2862362 RepID=A0AAV9ZH47_9AGAR
MPTIARLLLLAFVGLSIHVQAAPLPDVAAAVDVRGNLQVDHVASFDDSNNDDIERRALKKVVASKPVKPAKPVTKPAPTPPVPAKTPPKSKTSPAPAPGKTTTTVPPPPAKISASKSKSSQISTSFKTSPSNVTNPIIESGTVPTS